MGTQMVTRRLLRAAVSVLFAVVVLSFGSGANIVLRSNHGAGQRGDLTSSWPSAPRRLMAQPNATTPHLGFKAVQVSEEGTEVTCEEIYGALPCSTSVTGNMFLMLAYGYLVLLAAQFISDGSELLLQVLDPGIIGGLVLPILGAFPDSLLILVSGLKGTREEAQVQVLVGMGVLAGSTVMLLTAVWGGSLLCGRCDLVDRDGVGPVAKDKTLTKPWSLWESGVTTDEQTRLGAWIMMATVLPFIIMQIPLMDGGDAVYQGRIAALIGLVLAFAGLVAYCAYQILSPWLQTSKIQVAHNRYLRSLALRDLHNLARVNTWGALLNPDGSPNEETMGRVFQTYDEDSDGNLSRSEVRKLVLAFGVRQGALPEEEEVELWMREFDVNSDGTIGREEFVEGLCKWMKFVSRTHTVRGRVVANRGPLRSDSVDKFWEKHASRARGELEALNADMADEEDEEEEDIPKTPFQIITEASLLIAAGAALVAVFADPVVDSISAFSKASNIPAFFVAFVVTPLASNASELVSSLSFAMKKRKRNISLTYSQIYGAITMNNTLCLGVFLALVYCRGLLWEFSAEVVITLFVTLIVGVLGGSRRTFQTWMAFPVLALYPLSLAIVAFLDYVLGWK